jgi:HK97 gp10 family phage protein
MVVDAKAFKRALKDININASELLQIEGAGAYTLVNGMRMRVPVKSSATKNSISPHIVESSDVRVVDDVGPETNYAPYLEYGTGIFAEKGNGRKDGWVYFDGQRFWFTRGMKPQAFIRPTAFEDFEKVIRAIGTALGQFLISRWPK